MGGAKQTYKMELNPDHMDFLSATKEKFDIVDESKVMRIMVDYLLTNPGVHNAVFSETRCMRCE